jgi:hypothetical protein
MVVRIPERPAGAGEPPGNASNGRSEPIENEDATGTPEPRASSAS